MINVVHITENPVAGAPMNLSLALNKWQGDKISSRHIAASDRNEDRVYKSDLLTGVHTYAEIRQVMEQAHVFHFHNFYSKQDLFRKYPDLWDICLRRRRVWQVHSPRGTSWMDIEEGLRDKDATHLVIGQYHPREWPECKIIPNIVDITEPLLTPQERVWSGPLRVAFSPSRIGLLGWDNKGYNETVPVLQAYVNKGHITAEIIFGVPHTECLVKRGRAHIAIDEIITGSYHLCSLEALSQGCLTMAGLDQLQQDTLKTLTGASWLPWARVYADDLKRKLMYCVWDPGMVKILAFESRKWMEKYWHPKDMTNRFVEIYERL